MKVDTFLCGATLGVIRSLVDVPRYPPESCVSLARRLWKSDDGPVPLGMSQTRDLEAQRSDATCLGLTAPREGGGPPSEPAAWLPGSQVSPCVVLRIETGDMLRASILLSPHLLGPAIPGPRLLRLLQSGTCPQAFFVPKSEEGPSAILCSWFCWD